MRLPAADCWRWVLEKLLYKVPARLTDNGGRFTLQPQQWFPGGHSFSRIGRAFSGEHRLTKLARQWTNGQVERFNRAIEKAAVQRYHRVAVERA